MLSSSSIMSMSSANRRLFILIPCTDIPIFEKIQLVQKIFARFFASVGEFSEMDHQMLLTEFYPRPTLVVMVTKFKTKWAIHRLVQQMSPRSLHLT